MQMTVLTTLVTMAAAVSTQLTATGVSVKPATLDQTVRLVCVDLVLSSLLDTKCIWCRTCQEIRLALHLVAYPLYVIVSVLFSIRYTYEIYVNWSNAAPDQFL